MSQPVVCSNVDLVWILQVDFELRLIQFRDQVDRKFLKADLLYQVFEVTFLIIWKTQSSSLMLRPRWSNDNNKISVIIGLK